MYLDVTVLYLQEYLKT